MAKNEEKYEGEYKVEISDKGRINFNLNWKYAVGGLITILAFVGYLLLDKYHFEPMNDLRKENASLREYIDKEKAEREDNDKAIDVVVGNQKILLERSERTIKFIDVYNTQHNHTTTISTPDLPSGDGPGSTDGPGN